MTIPQRILKRLAALESRKLVSNEWPGGWHQYAKESQERRAVLGAIQTLAGEDRWRRHNEILLPAATAYRDSGRDAEALAAFDLAHKASLVALLEGLQDDEARQLFTLLARERALARRLVSPPPPVRAS